MEISQTKKSKFKSALGWILSCAILVQAFAFAIPAKATESSPRFNFLESDWELLRGANRTTNQQDWSDPVSGTAGDTFAGIIYYHNGHINTAAENTRIKVSIPNETTNNAAVITGSISADNADTITDTYIEDDNGNLHLEGKSGLTLNLDQEAKLSLVPGSVKWFPNFVSMSSSQMALPLGQTGNEITSNGIIVGLPKDGKLVIEGCWPYIGYVTFLVKSERVAQPELTINKTVRNLTKGETAFVKKNYAKPGDVLEYSVIVNNGGAGEAENLYLTDTIPANTSYVKGSTYVAKNGGAFDNIADGITGDGIALGSFSKDDVAEVRFKVKVSQGVANGETLTNTAFLHINKEVLTSTATTIVKFSIVAPAEEELPVTGADNVIISLLAATAIVLCGTYLKLRKKLKIAKF